MAGHPRFLTAGNPGPFTLDGTRTYWIGRRIMAIIDPGPDLEEHVAALAVEARGAERVSILLTHGHVDHASAAPLLADMLGCSVRGPAALDVVDDPLEAGESLPTDQGTLVPIATPGHAAEHLSFHWPERAALFAGDLLLGRGDTTWVGGYPGCVQDYLDSLALVRSLGLDVIYPAHGPPLEDPPVALDRFEDHRRDRIRQMRDLLVEHPEAVPDQLLKLVYGRELPEAVVRAATLSLAALREHVEDEPT